jgi:hypothetical protein
MAGPVWTNVDRKTDERVQSLARAVCAELTPDPRTAPHAAWRAVYQKRPMRCLTLVVLGLGKRAIDARQRRLVPRVAALLVQDEERQQALEAATQLGHDAWPASSGAAASRLLVDQWMNELLPPVDERRRAAIAEGVKRRADHAQAMYARALKHRDAAQKRLDKWAAVVRRYEQRGVLGGEEG